MGYQDKKLTAEEQAEQVKSLARQLEEGGGVGATGQTLSAPKKVRVATSDPKQKARQRAEAAQKRDERGGNGRSDRDERFGSAAVSVAKAALAHRQEDKAETEEAKAKADEAKAAANKKAKAALTEIGVATVENPFTNNDFKSLVGYLQEAILDPRVTVDSDRVPLGSLRALQNVVESPTDEASRAMHAFVTQRYDTTGLLLKAQAMIADAHNGNQRSIRFSPGGLEWATRQLRRIAGELAEGEGFDAQRRVAGYESLADKVEGLANKVFSKKTSDETEDDES